MAKNKKYTNFCDLEFDEIEKWERESSTIVMSSNNGNENDIAFQKSETFIREEFSGYDLILMHKNESSKNISIFSGEQIQRLKQFLNEHF